MTNVYEKILYLFIQNLAHAVICCISYRRDTFMCTWSREKDEIDIRAGLYGEEHAASV